MINIKIYSILAVLFLFYGCTSSSISLPKQKVVANINSETEINKNFLNKTNSKLYIFVEKKGVTPDSSNQAELPRAYDILIKSLLSDFGADKIEVIVENSTYKNYLKDKNRRPFTYQLVGALTQYDKNIMSKSSSFKLGVNFGQGDGETDLDADYTDSESKSVLGADIFLLQEESIVYKSSSKIVLHSVNEATSLAIMLNGGQIGYRSRIQLKDGLDSSVRKMFAVSLRNLISQANGYQSILR